MIVDWRCYFKLNDATVVCSVGLPNCHRVLPRQNESHLNIAQVSSALTW